MNGLLLIDKPSGMTSHDVVSRVRKHLKIKEIGHTGTLDPLASGLMVLLVGEATKLSSYVTDGDKAYKVGLKLGFETDTLDITGHVTKEFSISSNHLDNLKSYALNQTGEFQMPIPLYSAKKIDGKKLYEYARENEYVEIPTKPMSFWGIEVLSAEAFLEEGHSGTGLTQDCFAHFAVSCSKGSFIRTWVSELGKKLGCGAVMSCLRRTKSHIYELRDAIRLSDIETMSRENLESCLIPMDKALPDFKRIRVKGQDEVLLKNGQISHHLRTALISIFDPEKDAVVQVFPEKKGQILAIIGLDKQQGFKIKRVFNC